MQLRQKSERESGARETEKRDRQRSETDSGARKKEECESSE